MSLPRVLHLIDPYVPGSPDLRDASGGCPCTMRLIAETTKRITSWAHDVLVLGTIQDVKLAQDCGLDVAGQYCPPRILPLAGRRGLVRVMQRLANTRGVCHLIHGWTPRAAMYASITLPNIPRVCSVHMGLSHKDVGGVSNTAARAMFTRRATPVLAESQAVKRQVSSAEIDQPNIHVIPPGVDPASINTDDRQVVRTRWGVTDTTYVIGALAEPASSSDARIAIRVISSLRLTGRNVRMVMHHDASRRADAKWWAKKLGYEDLLIFDDLASQPWRIASALDAVWVTSASHNASVRPMSCLPLLWAMAAELPIVAEDAGATREFFTELQHGLIAPPGDIPAILDRLAHVYDEREWAASMACSAGNFVREHASPQQFAQVLSALYPRHATTKTVSG